jgi:hypothetical protein
MSDSGEIMRADPDLRRAVIIVVLVLFALLVLLYGLIGDPFEWLYGRLVGDVEALADEDPELARARAARIVVWAVASVWGSYLLIAAYGISLGIRMWVAEQWPRPGARLIADTPVVRGGKLRARAGTVIVVPLLLLVPITYYSWSVIAWARSA